MPQITFDIETGALPLEEIEKYCPGFEAPGNYRDEAKIQSYIAEKRKDWIERAALSATTGRVIAIGYLSDGDFGVIASGDEAEDISAFWALIQRNKAITQRVVGFNIASFDIPFLVRRSWRLGVYVPPTLFRGRYINEAFVDLMDSWRMGNREQSISLGDLAKFLNVGEKSSSGKDFAALWESDRASALSYLQNDLKLTELCAERMAIL